MKRLSWGLILLLVGSVAVSARDAEHAIVHRITGALMCTCGCPHLIRQCGDECSLAPQLKEGIAQLVRSGTEEQEILDMFVAKHGASVLAVPKAEGFNLLAWVLPFVGLGVGAMVVFMVARNLRPVGDGKVNPNTSEIDSQYRKLIDEELRR